jgi:predicted flap endonuclease-1-like 5' DNA nuclease
MNAVFLWWLTLGALIGFGAAWIWDWIYFRRPRQLASTADEGQIQSLTAERNRLQTDLRACGERSARLESEIAPLRTRIGALEPYQARVGELEAEVARLQARLGELEPYQARAGELEGEVGLLRGRIGELEPYQARVGELEGELAHLRAAATTTAGVTLGVALTDNDQERAVGGDDTTLVLAMRDSNVQLQDELDATRRALVRLGTGHGDPLIDINGIGPIYQERLYAQGIVSFEQLAAMSPERVKALVVAPDAVGDVDTGSWINEARRLAGRPRRDPLIDLLGVGPVYEQRFLDAGIFTFEQVGQLSVEEIRAIIKPEAWQNVDIPAWIAEAKVLAQQVRDGTYRKGRY